MTPKSGASSLYAASGRSLSQRVIVIVTAAISTMIAWWLLLGGGLPSIDGWFRWTFLPGNLTRRILLAAALSIYLVRLCFTQFVFLKRTLTWREAGMIAPWIFVLYLSFSLAGGTNPATTDALTTVGVGFFVAGSWMNTYAEYERNAWKKRPENAGRLYTLGLFRYSRHPNYLGDLLSFTGLALLTGRWVMVAIPLVMLGGFIFVNIPMLDSHLHDHYGDAFDAYARNTARLIPFFY
jgi:protein-S-isoprenylcysteine O-methyltransferase Ste14